MKKFNVQYSVAPVNTKPISEWREYSKIIPANSSKEAVKKFNDLQQHLGTWIILDCWEIQYEMDYLKDFQTTPLDPNSHKAEGR